MQPGDLVRVRAGCGDEGKIGLVISGPVKLGKTKFSEIMLGVKFLEINHDWLDVVSAIDKPAKVS